MTQVFENYKRDRKLRQERRRYDALSPEERFGEDVQKAIDRLVEAELASARVIARLRDAYDEDTAAKLQQRLFDGHLREAHDVRLDLQRRNATLRAVERRAGVVSVWSRASASARSACRSGGG